MENATKALIMAGGMLIALLVVSLLVVGWNNITNYNRKQGEIQTSQQIAKFNKEFESYNKGVIRGYDMVSLANLLKDTNARYSPIYDGYIEVNAYIKLLNDTPLLNYIKEGERKRLTQNSGMNLVKFKDEYYDFSLEHGESDFGKTFKEIFFECTKIVYDGDEAGDKGSGRVKALYFEQITEKE